MQFAASEQLLLLCLTTTANSRCHSAAPLLCSTQMLSTLAHHADESTLASLTSCLTSRHLLTPEVLFSPPPLQMVNNKLFFLANAIFASSKANKTRSNLKAFEMKKPLLDHRPNRGKTPKPHLC